MTGPVIYEENQTIEPAIIRLIILLFFAAVGVGYFAAGEQADNFLLAAAVPFAITMLILASLRMETIIDQTGIFIKTLYVFRRHIGFDEIETAEIITYRPIRDYGGWGIRISGKGKAYNMRGNRGVQLLLTRKRRVLIGSERPEALLLAIEQGMSARPAW